MVFGTEMLNPTDDGDTPPSPPPPLDLDFPSRFPPSYSQLPSKVGSVVSLETCESFIGLCFQVLNHVENVIYFV